MAIVRHIILLVLGAAVLVGCQKQGNETDGSTERPRQAGEIQSVSTQAGDLMTLSCVRGVVERLGAQATGVDMNSCITKKAVSGTTAAVARGRHFYTDATVTTTTYLYLPYYYYNNYNANNNYNYGFNNQSGFNYNYNDVSSANTGSALNQLRKLLFGDNCKKTDWLSYFGYNTDNYNSYNYNQYYKPACTPWLNSQNYTTYAYSPFNTSSSNSFYYNQNYYDCYNVY